MGQPKQLLEHGGTTLLRRAAQAAVDSDVEPIVVVLGAHAERLVAELADLPLSIVVNESWNSGIGSSIRAGIRALDGADFDAVAILLADQPFVNAAVLRRLTAAFRTTDVPIVASSYGDTRGVPALFDRTYLPQLAALSDDCGAKALIADAGGAVHSVPFPQGACDIDTPADYHQLQSRNQRNGGPCHAG